MVFSLIQWVIIVIIYFDVCFIPALISRIPFRIVVSFCNVPVIFSSISLLYDITWYPDSFRIFCVTVISQRSPIPPGEECYLRDKNWALSVLIAIKVALLVDLLCWQTYGMYVFKFTNNIQINMLLLYLPILKPWVHTEMSNSSVLQQSLC